MQLADALLFHPQHPSSDPSRVALALVYLVVRAESQARAHEQDVGETFLELHRGFQRKASPIFNDPLNFNAVFNEFSAETCSFELTEIIPMVKWAGSFLSMPFSFAIDSRVYESVLLTLLRPPTTRSSSGSPTTRPSCAPTSWARSEKAL
jgi:hypothetical protein